jgi:superfamily II DNA or RNA helicase
VKCADSRTVKALIARHILPGMATSFIGDIELYSHQRSGVVRILQAIDEFGGALLCDEVGLGKTYTAAAVMREFASSLVVAPASLLPMWTDALNRSGVRARILSVEQFSRRSIEPDGRDLVVVDEAHHLRNCATRRFRNLAAYTDRSRMLLLTATPIHNRRDDLIALLSLFLGSAAGSLTPSQLARCVIRRSRKSVADLPARIHAPAACSTISPEIRCRILSLPPPVPARDGEECAALVQFTLLRQWASSNAAMRAGLKMRIGRARALVSALEAGVYPTRREMTAWLIGSGDVQLAFPSLVAGIGGDPLLLETVREHEAACVALLSLLNASERGDEWRADTISRIRRNYAGRKVVVFTQFAATAHGLFSLLKREPRVGLITSRLCAIATGSVSREYILSRFAPRGSGTSPPVEREDISLLITTDLCSEGLNLQDASVLVHADLPWTAARVEQRIGRVARPGSPHSEVFIHSLNVPEISEDMLRMSARLRGLVSRILAHFPSLTRTKQFRLCCSGGMAQIRSSQTNSS